ncbi:MAG: polysaccharide deacetylase family protein [Candidatus Sulfotelmatobacter sp.]
MAAPAKRNDSPKTTTSMARMWIKKSLISTGALRLASRFTGAGVAIVMYHSVMNDPASAQTTLGGIIHSTEVFRGQMEVVARDFQAVSLDDVLFFLRGEKVLPPRAVVITFDDGYADNYAAANDILSPLGIPAVFYVTVDCIDRQRLPWPSLLRHAFLTSQNDKWNNANEAEWALSSTEERIRAFDRASQHCSKLSGIVQERFVESVQQQLGTDPPRPSQRLMMTWDEVRGLAGNGHTVGSHTMTHPNLAYLAEKDARTELLEAKRRLEQELTVPIVHFSYPCPALQPHWVDSTVSASKQIGYQTAVTTNGGLVRRHDDPLSLRRIRPTKTVEGLRWNLECAFLGRAV